MTKRMLCLIVIIVICAMTVSCSHGVKPITPEENTSPVSTNDNNKTPQPDKYTKCVFVLSEEPSIYETKAAEELKNFFAASYTVTELDQLSQNSSQDGILSIYINTDAAQDGYSILFGNDEISITASSTDLIYLASMRLKYDYFSGDPARVTSENIQALGISEKRVNREDYIKNIELFTPVWQYQWTPPAWMLDFNEKQNSFTAKGRMMCTAHRGGLQFYPENSIESIISSIKMGCDIIEIDIQRTKDDVLILMHGDLNECTDWAEKKGKNGLPKSQKVAGWTYEQLLELNLRFNYGQYSSETGEITPYKIPTLKEVMRVCRNRIFVNLDKIDCLKYWDDIYKVLKETESTQNFLFGKSFKDADADLEPYRRQMASDGLPVSLNYYSRKHTGDLSKDITLKTQTELNSLFGQYYKAGNNLLTDHPYECVQWISTKYNYE